MNIDVFYSDGESAKSNRHQEIADNISSGKTTMRGLLKEGKHDIVMYVRGDVEDSNRQYFFEKGKIKFIKDNF